MSVVALIDQDYCLHWSQKGVGKELWLRAVT